MGRRLAGAALGIGTAGVLVFSLWSLGNDAETKAPTVGIFGAAARPGTFAPDLSDPEASVTSRTTAPGGSGSAAPTSPTSATTTISDDATSTTDDATADPPVTTTTTLPETTTTTLSPLMLAAAGLGAADLGDPYAETVEAVSARLGDATEDTGWMNANSDFGICPGTEVRMIRWSSLRLLFSDGPTEFGEDARHFFYYSQSTVGTDDVRDLATSAGIELDSTVTDLKTAFDSDLTIESTIQFGVTFFVEPRGPGLLSGTLTDSTDTGRVTSIGGGFGCGG